MRHLQQLYVEYKGKGLVILGFNPSDDKKIALEFLAENGATFPTVLDSSDAAVKTGFQDYRMSGVPLNYIIDRQGKIVDAWYGNDQGHHRAKAALKKAGMDITEAPSSTLEDAKDGLLKLLRKALQ
jgi:peroxiredoxin